MQIEEENKPDVNKEKIYSGDNLTFLTFDLYRRDNKYVSFAKKRAFIPRQNFLYKTIDTWHEHWAVSFDIFIFQVDPDRTGIIQLGPVKVLNY